MRQQRDKSFDLDYDFNRKWDFRFTEIIEDGYTVTNATMGDLYIEQNVITTTGVNQNMMLLPNGSGQVLVNADPSQPLGIATKQYVDSLTTNHMIVSGDVSDFNTAVDNRITLQKGVNNGLATLDSAGKIPASQLPFTGTSYQGTWNATTNTPDIVSGEGTAGYFYIVAVAGTTSIDGNGTWNIGDWIVFEGVTGFGGVWQRSPSSNLVNSVAGKIGVVTLTASDITSGQFSNSLISLSNIVQYQGQIDIRGFMNAPLGNVVGTTDIQTLTYKTIDSNYNTLLNIADASISTTAQINVNKLADGSITNSMFICLNGVSSNIQGQLNNKTNIGHTHVATDIISGQFSSSLISQASVLQYQSAININRLQGSPVSMVVGISDIQTLTNKTIDANSNTILNIGNNQLSSGISLAKIGSGNVTSSQLDCLIGVTSNLQYQLNGKSNITHTHLWPDITNISAIVPYSNFNGNGPPGSTDDSTQHYQVGSRWIDVTYQQEYVCLSPSPANAIWTATTTVGGGGGGGGGSGIIVKYMGNNVPGTPTLALDFYAPAGGIVITNEGNSTAMLTVLATINDTDANLRNRATHTGTQLCATISDFNNGVSTSSHALNHNNPHQVTAAQVGLENVQNILNNYNGQVEPLPSNDSTQGYVVGSFWINDSVLQASNNMFVCLDNTANYAVWTRIISQPIYYQQPIVANVSSTGANTVTLIDISTVVNKAYYIECQVVAKRTDVLGEVGAYDIQCLFINVNGVVTKTADDKLDISTDWPWYVCSTVSESGTDILITATGEAAKQILWRAVCNINMV